MDFMYFSINTLLINFIFFLNQHYINELYVF